MIGLALGYGLVELGVLALLLVLPAGLAVCGAHRRGMERVRRG